MESTVARLRRLDLRETPAPSDSATQFARNLVAQDRTVATRIFAALAAVLGTPEPTPGQAAYLQHLASP